MQKINVADLEFNKFEDFNTPEMQCNMCRKSSPAHGWHVAEVKIAEDAELMIVICSDQCLEKFKHHPGTSQWLDDAVYRASRSHKMPLINLSKKPR